jgi:hypothetical protein
MNKLFHHYPSTGEFRRRFSNMPTRKHLAISTVANFNWKAGTTRQQSVLFSHSLFFSLPSLPQMPNYQMLFKAESGREQRRPCDMSQLPSRQTRAA